MRERVRNYVYAGLTTLLGTAAVFFVVIYMNEIAGGLDESELTNRTTFTVERAEPEKPEPIVQKHQPEPKQKPLAPPPPLASLDSAIGGVDIPLPGFDLSQLNRLDGSLGADKNLVMTDETVDQRPEAVSQRPMTYPADAKTDGVEGYVTLSLLIGESGEIQDVRVLESTPSGVFDEVAVEGIRQWEFTPATYQGEPVTVWARQTIRFNLG